MCQRAHPLDKPIDNAEFQLGAACAREMCTSNESVVVKELITDCDSHSFVGFRSEVEKAGEGIHIKKWGLHSSSNKICWPGLNNMKLDATEGRLTSDTIKNKRDQSTFVEKRCSWEFQRAHITYGRDVEILKTECRKIKSGVIKVFER